MMKPFASELFEQYQNGCSIEALVTDAGIPRERVEIRLMVASLLMGES